MDPTLQRSRSRGNGSFLGGRSLTPSAARARPVPSFERDFSSAPVLYSPAFCTGLYVRVFRQLDRAPASEGQKGERGPMRRLRSLTLSFTPAALFVGVFVAVALSPGPAKADITIFDGDGWTLHTTGFVAAHYQLIT